MISRRQVLIVAAASACAGFAPRRQWSRWQGRAFGAEVTIAVAATHSRSQAAVDAARDTVKRCEQLFSLYDPTSQVSQLNRTGRLVMAPEFARLVGHVDKFHRLTNGSFDPTVQPLFALKWIGAGKAAAERLAEVRRLIGWHQVRHDGRALWFERPGMALTLNGIAQGFATDRVCEVLQAHGYTRYLVNVGEHRGGGDAARLTVEDVDGQDLGRWTMTNEAIATSSSHGFAFADGTGHILDPKATSVAAPAWKTVSVVAPTAVAADALSTALVLERGTDLAGRLKREGHVLRALLQSPSGNIVRI